MRHIITDNTLAGIDDRRFADYLCHAYCSAGHCEFEYNGQTFRFEAGSCLIIPFTTHEGSGLGRCAEDIKRSYPQAEVTGAFSLYGHEVRGSKKKAETWLKELGYGS